MIDGLFDGRCERWILPLRDNLHSISTVRLWDRTASDVG